MATVRPEYVPQEPHIRRWGHGLFSCFHDCHLCLFTYACPHIVFGRLAARIDKPFMPYLLLYFAPFVNVCFCVQIRREIRDLRKIPGSLAGDLTFSLCFSPCTLIQETLELDLMDLEKESQTGKRVPVTSQPPEMSMDSARGEGGERAENDDTDSDMQGLTEEEKLELRTNVAEAAIEGAAEAGCLGPALVGTVFLLRKNKKSRKQKKKATKVEEAAKLKYSKLVAEEEEVVSSDDESELVPVVLMPDDPGSPTDQRVPPDLQSVKVPKGYKLVPLPSHGGVTPAQTNQFPSMAGQMVQGPGLSGYLVMAGDGTYQLVTDAQQQTLGLPVTSYMTTAGPVVTQQPQGHGQLQQTCLMMLQHQHPGVTMTSLPTTSSTASDPGTLAVTTMERSQVLGVTPATSRQVIPSQQYQQFQGAPVVLPQGMISVMPPASNQVYVMMPQGPVVASRVMPFQTAGLPAVETGNVTTVPYEEESVGRVDKPADTTNTSI